MNDIHPTALVGPHVRLGTGNVIGPHVVITGPVTIGDGNWIGTGVVIGAPPEVRSFEHPRPEGDYGAGVRVGSRNVIREYAQVHQGWKSATTIGDDGFIMNQVYVAHDCTLGNSVTMASSVLLAGHVVVNDFANLGLGTAVHQGRWVGHGSMIGMASVVTRDIPPFAKAYGNPARVAGTNTVGMQRLGVPESVVEAVRESYAGGQSGSMLRMQSRTGLVGIAFSLWDARGGADA